MHNWLIFQYRRERVRTNLLLLRGCAPFGCANRPTMRRLAMEWRRKIGDPRRWLSWGKCVGRGPGKSGPLKAWDTIPSRSDEVIDSLLPRKASSEFSCCPYPKPTQVDRSRRPRRVSELWLRNSAKYLCNFGIKRASMVTGLAPWAWWGGTNQREATVY